MKPETLTGLRNMRSGKRSAFIFRRQWSLFFPEYIGCSTLLTRSPVLFQSDLLASKYPRNMPSLFIAYAGFRHPHHPTPTFPITQSELLSTPNVHLIARNLPTNLAYAPHSFRR